MDLFVIMQLIMRPHVPRRRKINAFDNSTNKPKMKQVQKDVCVCGHVAGNAPNEWDSAGEHVIHGDREE